MNKKKETKAIDSRLKHKKVISNPNKRIKNSTRRGSPIKGSKRDPVMRKYLIGTRKHEPGAGLRERNQRNIRGGRVQGTVGSPDKRLRTANVPLGQAAQGLGGLKKHTEGYTGTPHECRGAATALWGSRLREKQ